MAHWSRSMSLAEGAKGPGFNPGRALVFLPNFPKGLIKFYLSIAQNIVNPTNNSALLFKIFFTKR